MHLRVRNDDSVRPIWTVTGRITGTESPDQLVIVGNHRDAWVYGGVDPSSGTASLLELARSLGALARQGTRPRRTIVFANWDAEEFSLTSSTEWGEQHARELADHAVAYLNVDSSVAGPDFKASAVPSLNRLVTQSARDVLGLRESDDAIVSNRLGSGSDYTVFLNFLGVPIADMTFTGPYGVYHSVYDNHLWMQKFGDPGFLRHVAMTRVWGVTALRLANADVLPLDYRATADRVREFVTETVDAAGRIAEGRAQAADRRRRSIRLGGGGRRHPHRRPARDRRARPPFGRAARRHADQNGTGVSRRGRPPGAAVVPPSALRAEADVRAGGTSGRHRVARSPRFPATRDTSCALGDRPWSRRRAARCAKPAKHAALIWHHICEPPGMSYVTVITPSETPAPPIDRSRRNYRHIRVLRWTFRRDDEAVVCELALTGEDREYELRAPADWNPTGASVERFDDALTAFQRHAMIERMLLDAGWQLDGFESEKVTLH